MFYFPILRAKQGEIKALLELQFSTQQAIYPVLQVAPPDLEYSGTPVSPDSDYVQKVARTILPALSVGSPLRCFLDLTPASLPDDLLQQLLEAIAEQGGTPQPVYRLTDSEAHARLQRQLIGEPRQAILRVGVAELRPTLPTQLAEAMHRYGLRPDQTLLLLDMGDISTPGLPLGIYELALADAISRTQPLNLAGIIVASAALPTKTEIPKWTWVQFTRHELDVFRNIKAATSAELHFSDYGVGNVITGPMASRPGTPKVRYTTATTYEVMRGQKDTGAGTSMSEQYHRLSGQVVAHQDYSGQTFSWGDDHIYRASFADSKNRGNATTWVTVHTAHHIELVVSMLPAM